MSLLEGLDFDNIPEDPNFIPPNVYQAFLTDVKGPAGTKNDANKKGITFVYKISEGEYAGKTVNEWKSCNADDDVTKKSYLKQRFISLGVPADRVNSVETQDVVGKEVYITVVVNKGYTNVNKVVLVSESEGTSTKGSFEL